MDVNFKRCVMYIRFPASFIFSAVIFLFSQSISAQTPSDVVSLQNSNPTSSDIVDAFMQKPSSEEDLPEGLMEGIGDGGSEAKYRGISFSNKSQPEMAVEKSLTGSQPVATCPTNNAIAVNINFKLNSAQLDETNMDLLHEISKAMNSQELSSCQFIVEGHTDALGDDEYNMQLSRNRALEVKSFLANASVAYSRMKVVGKGETDLIIQDNPNDARNRRVQFRISN